MAQTTHVSRPQDGMSIGAPLYSNIGPVELLPNPDFVFPLPESSPSSSTDALPIPGRRPRSLQPLAATRRGSAHARGKSANLLPEFSFNPSGEVASSAPAATSPLPSLPTTPTTPHSSYGHRRGGSEFIGGDGKNGPGVMSASPTKGESLLPPPAAGLLPGPPAGRRGHAHRRSGAISSHDLSTIMGPKHVRTPTAGGSAPSTPMENDVSSWSKSQISKHSSQPSLHASSAAENLPPTDDAETSPDRPLSSSRTRVGFSEKVEYIRPLSTISSETESSMSTIRGHSVTNSLSSVVSIGAPSPPGRRSRLSLNASPEPDMTTSRPSTAGAILDFKNSGTGFGQHMETRKRPMSALLPNAPLSPISVSTASPGTPKKRNFFSLSSWHSEAQDYPTTVSEPSLSAIHLETPPASPVKELLDTSEEEGGEPVRVSSQKSKKPRKVKSWANSIIRKSKSQSRPKDASQESPEIPPIPAMHEEVSPIPSYITKQQEVVPDFDADNTVTIVSPSEIMHPHTNTSTDFANWKPKHMATESDSRSPVIDLDLAFGPFEDQNRWSTGPRGPRRAMHSAGFLGGAQHRRTESAPALVPFENRSTVLSTNVMADVFEEEEEEEEQETPSDRDVGLGIQTVDKSKETAEDEEMGGVGISLVDSDMATGSAIKWNFEDGMRSHKRHDILSPVLETPQSPFSAPQGLGDFHNTGGVEIVEDHEEPRASSITQSSDSTVTPTDFESKELPSSLDPPPPFRDQSLRTPDTVSSLSSGPFDRSQSSFETHRLGTAASSFTDSRTGNSLSNEPGPDYRDSADIPSLTGSMSTGTTGAYAYNLVSPRILGDRAASVTSFQSTHSEQRRSKRSSIASLSKLMGVGGSFGDRAFGERSKLNIEQRPQSEHMDLKVKETKPKKSRRLSKMMFWRSKHTSK